MPTTHVTETIYRHVIAPAARGGVSVMDTVFGDGTEDGGATADAATSNPGVFRVTEAAIV